MAEIRVKLADAKKALQTCNLFKDHLVIVFPNEPIYWFFDTEDELYKFMDSVEENVERNGGYMIDQWQFVDAAQNLYDARSRVSLCLDD